MAELHKDHPDRPYTAGDDIDLDQIVHNAVASVALDSPKSDLTLRTRLALFLAAIIVVANSVIGIYNSIALRQEVSCNHQLTTALNVVGDQNRNITKNAFDTLLSTSLTPAQKAAAKLTYDTQFKKNTAARSALLKTTCNDGSSPPPTNTSGS